VLSHIDLQRNHNFNRKKVLEYFTENPNNRVERDFLIKDLFEKECILRSDEDSGLAYWSEDYMPDVQKVLREFCDLGFLEIIIRYPGHLYSEYRYSLVVSKECIERHINRCEKDINEMEEREKNKGKT